MIPPAWLIPVQEKTRGGVGRNGHWCEEKKIGLADAFSTM
jgi:hypothetical protein